jgi:MFS transporter, Spinster family, sphingosine-1-phosphate transporter
MASNSTPLSSYQIRLLAVLSLINFVNFADRQVIGPLLPLLRQQMNLTDAQLGSLQSLLLVVLAIASVPCGFFADRWSRTRIITAGVLVWSLATIACGFATSFMLLLVARSLIGFGEAAYAPAAQSMISDSFPYQGRAVAQAIFASGMLLGGAAGQVLGGIVGENYGWKLTFILVGVVCMIPGLFVVRLPEPPRRPRSEVVPISSLLSVPAYVAMIAAGTCITFASVSLLTWGIDFAKDYKEFSLKEAAVSLAIVSLLSLALGVLAGGFLADRLHRKYSYGRILVIAAAFLFAAPFVLLAIQTEEKWIFLMALFIGGFFMSWYHGPVTAVLHDLTPQCAHATAIGVYMFVTQLLGALGPQLVGKISDASDLQLGLQVAVAVMVGGALLMLVAIYFVRRDGLHHPRLAAFRIEAHDEACD